MKLNQIIEHNKANLSRCTYKQVDYIMNKIPFLRCCDIEYLYTTIYTISNDKHLPKYSCIILCWDKDKDTFRCSYTFYFNNRNRLLRKIRKLQCIEHDIVCKIISINSFN